MNTDASSEHLQAEIKKLNDRLVKVEAREIIHRAILGDCLAAIEKMSGGPQFVDKIEEIHQGVISEPTGLPALDEELSRELDAFFEGVKKRLRR